MPTVKLFKAITPTARNFPHAHSAFNPALSPSKLPLRVLPKRTNKRPLHPCPWKKKKISWYFSGESSDEGLMLVKYSTALHIMTRESEGEGWPPRVYALGQAGAETLLVRVPNSHSVVDISLKPGERRLPPLIYPSRVFHPVP